jgi:hypothetical protein
MVALLSYINCLPTPVDGVKLILFTLGLGHNSLPTSAALSLMLHGDKKKNNER